MDSSFNRFLTTTNALHRASQPVRDLEKLRRLAGLDVFDEARLDVGMNEIQRLAAQYTIGVSSLSIRHSALDALASFKEFEATNLMELSRRIDKITASVDSLDAVQKLVADVTGRLATLQPSAATLLKLAHANRPFEQAIAAARAALLPFSQTQHQSLIDALSQMAEASDLDVAAEDIAAFKADIALQTKAAEVVAGIATGLHGGEKTFAQMTGPEIRALFKQVYNENKESVLSKVFWAFVMALFVNLLNSVFSFYLTYYGTKHFDAKSSQEATKQVKHAGREAIANRDVLNELRFVSAKSLMVRTRAGARAPALGQLQFGQMVHLLRKDGEFSLVTWRSEEDQAELQGWVFSRYLKRFD